MLPWGVLVLVGCSAAPEGRAADTAGAADTTRSTMAATAPPATDGDAALDLAAIDAQAARAPTQTGQTIDGDATATWVAAYDGERLQRIVEELQRGDYAQSALHHYFVAGRHRATRERRLVQILNPNGAPTVDTVEVDVRWRADGTVVDHRKTVNGRERPMQPFEITELAAHVGRVAQQALLRGPAAPR